MMSVFRVACFIFILLCKGCYCQNTTTPTPSPRSTNPRPICGAPPEVSGGSGIAYGNPPRANYTCEEGRQLSGSASIQCRNGVWSAVPTCHLKFCPSPPRLRNGRFHSSGSYKVGVSIRYTCYGGYDIKPTNENYTVICQSDWTWSRDLDKIKCQPKDCGIPVELPNGNRTLSANKTVLNSQAIYRCNEGYRLIPPSTSSGTHTSWTSRCGSEGSWSSPPTCTAVSCGPPEEVENSTKWFIGQNKYGDSVTYECKPGYEMSGNSTISCLATGRWGAKPSCQKSRCPEPPNVKDASTTSLGDHTFGGRVKYECLKGYRADTSTYIVCLSNKEWTDAPECKIVRCRKPPSISHGSVEWSKTDYNFTAKYTCESGYKLIGSHTIRCGPESEWGVIPKCEIPNSSNGGSDAAAQTDGNPTPVPNYNSGQIVASLSIACTIFGITCLILIILISIKMCPRSSSQSNWVQMS